MGNRAEAKRLLDHATEVVTRDRTQGNTAYAMFDSACVADPTFSEAWYAQGNNNGDLRRDYAAIAGFRRALECNPDPGLRGKILTNLAWRLHQVGHTREALEAAEQAIILNPANAAAWVNVSCIQGTLRRMKASVEAAEKAKAIAPEDTVAGMSLAFAYLFDRQWARGYAEFEIRFRYRLHHFLHYPYPAWRGEEGACIFCVYDQGLGDTISFARFVEPAARRCRFLYVCIQPELRRWFETAFSHLENVTIVPGSVNFPGDAQFWTTYMSLPHALSLSDAEIETAPPIRLPLTPMSDAWRIPDRKLHVGIAWAGSPANDIDRHRNIPLHHFLDLYRVPGLQLYGLQVDERRNHIYELGAVALIRDLAPYVQDVSDTLAVLRRLDLVITAETALGHIAGAAGIETWVPYSWLGRDHRLGPAGERPLWYKKHRTFNQGPDCRWEPVFEEIVKALRKKVRE